MAAFCGRVLVKDWKCIFLSSVHLFVTTKTDRFFSFLSWVKRPRDITPLLASIFCYAQVVRLTVSVLLTIPFILTVTSGYFRRLRKTSVLFVTTGITEKKMR